MLSKSKGQLLRVAAVLHVLFYLDSVDDIPSLISERALKAADNFVSVCLQHAAYMAGRGLMEDAIHQAETRKCHGGEELPCMATTGLEVQHGKKKSCNL